METVSATTVWTRETAVGAKRDLWSAMKRGFRCRCPRCGEGKMFRAFLKTANNCSVCGSTSRRTAPTTCPPISSSSSSATGADRFVKADCSPAVWLQRSIYLPLDLRALAGTAHRSRARRRAAIGPAHARL